MKSGCTFIWNRPENKRAAAVCRRAYPGGGRPSGPRWTISPSSTAEPGTAAARSAHSAGNDLSVLLFPTPQFVYELKRSFRRVQKNLIVQIGQKVFVDRDY